MATIFIQATAVCGGGGHANITATMSGGPTGNYVYHISQIRDPVSKDEGDAMVLALMRLHGVGISDAQLRNDLQAGITVTV